MLVRILCFALFVTFSTCGFVGCDGGSIPEGAPTDGSTAASPSMPSMDAMKAKMEKSKKRR